MTRYLRIRRTLIVATLFVGVAGAASTVQANAATAAFPNVVVPAPVSETANGATFTLTSSATVSSDVPDVGAYLAGILRASTGYPVPVTSSSGTIALSLSGAPASVGTQGYQLTITGTNVTVQANQPAGLFAGVQTLLQLLPPAIESPTVTAGPWTAPGGTIVDYPRFAHRGAMLDVARHFFTVAQVERDLDEIARYKTDYSSFINRAQQIVAAHGKTVIGWHDIANATLLPSTVAQFWDTTTSNAPLAAAVANGTKVVMSPANHAYLDMKYNRHTKLGQTWAGLVDVNTAYGWNPGAYLSGVAESSVLGVEAPLWTETIVTSADIDYMAFPRLPAIAELGWSPGSTHDVTAFDSRLGAQGPRWKVMGVNYYHSTQITWPSGS